VPADGTKVTEPQAKKMWNYFFPRPLALRVILKTILKLFAIVFFMTFIYSCASKDKIKDGFHRGMYEGANQSQEMKRGNPLPSSEKPPTYDQYERERQEMLTDHDRDQ
jgi:hypothetical protein